MNDQPENNNSEELNKLQAAKKQLQEQLKKEYDPQIRMEYEAELDSINEQIEEFEGNNENKYEEPEEDIKKDESEELEKQEDYEEPQPNDIASNTTYTESQSKTENIADEHDDVLDANYTILEPGESTFEKATRIAKEYTKTKAREIKENSKEMVYNTASKIKNTRPFRIARSIGRFGKHVFKGFKTAGLLTIGIGVVSVEAVQNAKRALEKASTYSIKDVVNNGRETADNVLDKLEEKIIAENKVLDDLQNQQMHNLKLDGR